MEAKFKIGDMFTLKNTRDDIPLKIIEIEYRFGLDPTYTLKPILLCGSEKIIGEEALIEKYNKINK